LETRKRIYVGLLAGSLLFTLAIAGLGWYLITNRDFVINQVLLVTLAAAAGVCFIILSLGTMAIVIMIFRSKTMPSLEGMAQAANEILFPLTLVTGKLLGINKESILRSYIAVNNYLVKAKKMLIPGHQIMLLLPHCLQNSECPFKITVDIDNCKECGKCKIAELKELARQYNATIKVATGGTLARKFIKETRPRGVVAVACERDLSAGIHDMGILPVIGVFNCRPNGPCIDTDVDVEAVEEALKTLCKGG